MKKYLLSLLLMCFPLLSFGQDHLKIIVPFSAGGAADRAARLLETPLSNKLNQSILIEYKTGAGGIIGHSTLASSTPDKLVLGMTTMSVVANTILKTPEPYSLDKIIPIAYIRVPFVLLISPKLNIKNLKELQNHNGRLSYGSFGHASATHIISEQLAKNLKKEWIHVPYQGAPPIMQALLAGDIDMAFLFYPQAMSLMNSHKLTPLTIDLPRRHPDWPKIPTFAEFNLQQVSDTSYVILVSNLVNNTTEVTKVQTAIRQIFKDKDLIEKFNKNGFVVDFDNLITSGTFLTTEKTRISKLITNLNILLE